MIYHPGYFDRIVDTMSILYGDGTFQTAPDPFFMFYVVLTKVNLVTIPIAYSFLPTKSSDGYVEIFKVFGEFLVHKEISLAIDFEMAVVKSISEIYGEGCTTRLYFFHLQKSFDKQLVHFGYTVKDGKIFSC